MLLLNIPKIVPHIAVMDLGLGVFATRAWMIIGSPLATSRA
jgi:hypothetical protein